MSEDTTLDNFISNEENGQSPIRHVYLGPKQVSLPTEWGDEKLGDTASVTKLAGYEYTNDLEYDPEGDIKIVRGLNLKGNRLSEDEEYKYINKQMSDKLERSKLREGDIAMSYVGTVGIPAFVPESNKYHLGANVAKISPNEQLNGRFLHYFIQSSYIKDQIKARVSQTSQPALSMSRIRQLVTLIPSVEEQRKITTVLYTVDQAIEKTEEIIGQYERVTNGLQRTLLREGPDLGESTQSTPTGQYPSLWKMVRAGEYLDLRNGEFLSKDDRDESGKYPVYGGNGIMGYTDESTVGEDTLVIGRVGAYCGNIHITKSDAWVTDNAIVITQLSDEYMPRFLAYLLDEIGLGQFSEQSAQPRISQSTVENLRIPKPPIEDQSDIVEKLDSVETAKETEEKYQSQLQRLKQGLMQDLLSGTVRTTDTNIQVPDEVAQHG